MRSPHRLAGAGHYTRSANRNPSVACPRLHNACNARMAEVVGVHGQVEHAPAAGVAQLMDAERRAGERYDRLAGYPDDVREAARILWEAASEAVTTFHSPRRPGANRTAGVRGAHAGPLLLS